MSRTVRGSEMVLELESSREGETSVLALLGGMLMTWNSGNVKVLMLNRDLRTFNEGVKLH